MNRDVHAHGGRDPHVDGRVHVRDDGHRRSHCRDHDDAHADVHDHDRNFHDVRDDGHSLPPLARCDPAIPYLGHPTVQLLYGHDHESAAHANESILLHHDDGNHGRKPIQPY